MFIRYRLIIADVKVYAWAVNAADIGPVQPDAQSQSSLDLFLIFVGANVVATTFQVGASLASSFTVRAATLLILVGSVAGAALVAALAPLGPRLRVPSVIAARPALGIRGAGLVAVVLYVSNFAWIALNNVIAASGVEPGRRHGGAVRRRRLANGVGHRPRRARHRDCLARTLGGRTSRPRGGAAVGDRRGGAHRRLRARAARPCRSAGVDDELVARARRGHRLSGVVDSDVRRLLALHAVGARQHDRGVFSASR